MTTMPRLSTSSWSLHRALGRPPLFGPGDPLPSAEEREQPEIVLLELPHRLAQMKIPTLEIVHFHFPTTDTDYLAELSSALSDAGVELFSVLIDAGDITHPEERERSRQLAWIRSWIDVAATCGAHCARVVAGNASVEPNGGDLRDDPVLRTSAENLRWLSAYGRERDVRVITENFRATAARAENLLALLDLCEGEVGLCADFGNFKGPDKYEQLAAILPRADSVHAKGEYPVRGEMDEGEFTRCLEMLAAADFHGPISLIFDSALTPGQTEWDNLAQMRGVVAPYTAPVGPGRG